jgi:hypothetical protein
MKRLALFVAVGALFVGVAWPAAAQQAPSYTVTFGGQFRAAGIAFNNLKDFEDTDNASCTSQGFRCKDSDSFLHERFRLFTTIESADKKARVFWALEIGDLVFGAGGGASGAEYGGTTTRVGNGSGGGLGNDGVNVETKNLYLWVDTGNLVPGTNVLVGMHNIVFLNSPAGAFMDDDAMGIQLNFKFDPVDVQLWMAKTDENNRFDADDNTMYTARLGVNITKDMRFTVEGLVVDEQCFARRAAVAPATTGTCVSADFGDTFWVGGSAGLKIANINLDGQVIYGQRKLFSAANSAAGGREIVEEKGWGAIVMARVPVGPLSTWFIGWYTTGDENRPVGTAVATGFPETDAVIGAGRAFSTSSNTTRLNRDSDKLPIPIGGASWLGAPFVGEALNHSRTTGNISVGQPLYNDWTGTWGLGGSATFALLPNLSVGGGAAYVRLTEEDSGGVFGKDAWEFDAGLLYTHNAQTSFQLVGSYIVPDETDNAWAVIWRALYAF